MINRPFVPGQVFILVADPPPVLPRLFQLGHKNLQAISDTQKSLPLPNPLVSCSLTLSGGGLVSQAGIPDLPVGRGQIILRRSGDPLTFRHSGAIPWELLHIALAGSGALACADDLIRRFGHILTIDRTDPLWSELVALVPGGYAHTATWPLVRTATVAARVLAALHPAPTVSGRSDDLATRCLDLLDRVPGLRNIQDLASRLNVSREHLSRRCRASGIDLGALVRRKRLAMGLGMLPDRNLSLADIARKCGWSNVLAFSRAVRRHTGKPPRAWRRPTASGGEEG